MRTTQNLIVGRAHECAAEENVFEDGGLSNDDRRKLTCRVALVLQEADDNGIELRASLRVRLERILGECLLLALPIFFAENNRKPSVGSCGQIEGHLEKLVEYGFEDDPRYISFSRMVFPLTSNRLQ